MKDYKKQAEDFLKKYNIIFEAKKSAIQVCGNWTPCGYKYDVIFIKRDEYGVKQKEFFLNFWGSLGDKKKNRVKLSAYDVLACLTKYEVGALWDFIKEYGYEAKEKTEHIYQQVRKEWEDVESFFSAEELEELREIQ